MKRYCKGMVADLIEKSQIKTWTGSRDTESMAFTFCETPIDIYITKHSATLWGQGSGSITFELGNPDVPAHEVLGVNLQDAANKVLKGNLVNQVGYYNKDTCYVVDKEAFCIGLVKQHAQWNYLSSYQAQVCLTDALARAKHIGDSRSELAAFAHAWVPPFEHTDVKNLSIQPLLDKTQRLSDFFIRAHLALAMVANNRFDMSFIDATAPRPRAAAQAPAPTVDVEIQPDDKAELERAQKSLMASWDNLLGYGGGV